MVAQRDTGTGIMTEIFLDAIRYDIMATAEPTEYNLYWADLHKHMTGPGADRSRIDEVVSDAEQHLDVVAIHCYPFKWHRKGREGGIREESTGHDPDFDTWWTQLQRASKRHLEPGEFVTIPAYEWHGNRAEWGDHNVYFRDEGYPMDSTREFPELLDSLDSDSALVIPHHTAYEVGNRGKNWTIHDSSFSPVSEVYSAHGSSEAVDAPVPMDDNDLMGPRTSGGTYRDALDRGRRIGAIASNDGPGLPGSWNDGIAGIWATELTREGIWEAIKSRRTYGVTGDRIRLWWTLNGHPLGSEIAPTPEREIDVSVDCPLPLDRIEVVHNGEVAVTYTHNENEDTDADERYRILVEFGWGPSPKYGDFEDVELTWSGTFRVLDGELTDVQPRFTNLSQSYAFSDGSCSFNVRTSRAGTSGLLPEGETRGYKQGFVLEVTGDQSVIEIDFDARETQSIPLPEARLRDHLFAFEDRSRERLKHEFELGPDDISNPDVVYHNAEKVRVHQAHPRSACVATKSFEDVPRSSGTDYYYVRVSQRDGQYAWASPVWMSEE